MAELQNHLTLKRCPHCRVDNPNITEKNRFITNSFDGRHKRHWAVYVCNRCGGVITGASDYPSGWVKELYPDEIEVADSLPEKAKAFLDQAIDSLHAPSGAIMLAASSIDAMLKDKGYKKGSLYSRINKATEDHLITDGMSKWAHEVRLGANDERHADEEAELPDGNDAKRTVDFALALAEFLFVLPSRVEKGIKSATEPEESDE
tara:strand:+ start:46 stop:660 length:615 start_codon:yes stop_codon:yes gene_type:complete